MIRLSATPDECADLLIRVLCRAFACTVTTVQNGGSVRTCECRSCGEQQDGCGQHDSPVPGRVGDGEDDRLPQVMPAGEADGGGVDGGDNRQRAAAPDPREHPRLTATASSANVPSRQRASSHVHVCMTGPPTWTSFPHAGNGSAAVTAASA